MKDSWSTFEDACQRADEQLKMLTVEYQQVEDLMGTRFSQRANSRSFFTRSSLLETSQKIQVRLN